MAAFLLILLCISLYLYYEVYYDEVFGISLISIRYLSLSIRIVIVLKKYIEGLLMKVIPVATDAATTRHFNLQESEAERSERFGREL